MHFNICDLFYLQYSHQHVPAGVTLLPFANISKPKNILEYYYIHYCQQHNTIIQKQNQKENNPLFEIIQDTYFHHASAKSPHHKPHSQKQHL